MGNIILGFFISVIILTTFLYGSYRLLKKKGKLDYFILLFSLYIILLCILNYFIIYKNVIEYNSFNNLVLTEVKSIYVNNKKVERNKISILFDELKIDTFSWVNHPIIINSDTILVNTKSRKYKFIIQNTSNQGVLVTRINKEGKDYTINRNDNLLQSIEFIVSDR